MSMAFLEPVSVMAVAVQTVGVVDEVGGAQPAADDHGGQGELAERLGRDADGKGARDDQDGGQDAEAQEGRLEGGGGDTVTISGSGGRPGKWSRRKPSEIPEVMTSRALCMSFVLPDKPFITERFCFAIELQMIMAGDDDYHRRNK